MSDTAIRAGVVRQFQLFLALDGSMGHHFSDQDSCSPA